MVQNKFQGGLRGTGHDDDFLNVPHHEHPGRVFLRRVSMLTAFFRHAYFWKNATSYADIFLVQIPNSFCFIENEKYRYRNVMMLDSKSTLRIK